jgi:hypothetical protein
MNDDIIYKDNKHSLWNHHIEEVVKDIGESSKAYKIMHMTEAQNATKIYNLLMITGIVMGPLSGIVSAIGASLNISDYPSITISQIILGFLSGIFIAILKFGRYEEVSNSNKSAAVKYASIESNIRRQLSLYRSDRVPANYYIGWIEIKYDETIASAPLLNNNVFEEYKTNATKNGWKIPGQYSDTITINEEYKEKKVEEMINKSKIETVQEEDIENCFNEDKKPEIKEDNYVSKISRNNTMGKFSEVNYCSDEMLRYEMKRMLRF